MKKLLCLLTIVLGFQFTYAQFNSVKTVNGLISGTKEGNLYIFKGIPFAAPPVGDLRWKAPQAVKNWQGIKKCDAFSANPMQAKPVPFMCWTEEFIAPPEPLSEDCLYLNVWTAARSAKDKRPVFVWIYGGGFSSGSAACAIYDGADLAKKGVVFVSINYRVGVFGFMAHPELTREAGTSGNYGLLDQIEALKWIQKNISAFGGDPDNVTIAGQSAGSMSVNCLVASPLAKGLFHKAIAESGGLLSGRFNSKLLDAEKLGETFQKKVNAQNLKELRSKSAEELQKVVETMGGLRFMPTMDDVVIPQDITNYFKADKHNDVPLLTGWVTGDGALFGNQPITVEKFKQQAQEKYGADAEEYLKIFPAATDEEAKAMQTKAAMFSFAAYPSHLWAKYNKSKAYLYQFSHVPPDKPDFPNYGAFHTSEVPYALHTLHLWKREWQKLDYELENSMADYWVNFAKTGDPNGENLPTWGSYDVKSGVIMQLGNKVEARVGFFKQAFDFLDAH